MKRGSTLFLKLAIILIGIVTLAGLVIFPLREGRAVNLNLINIYLDPIIIYSYFASIPFFYGLSQAFTLLNLIDADQAFSQNAVNTFKNMKYAFASLIGFIFVGLLFIRFFAQGDDPAGPTTLGLGAIFGITIIATVAAVFEKLLQNAVDIKSENDLTV